MKTMKSSLVRVGTNFASWRCWVFGAVMLVCSIASRAVPPPTGVAPVLVPSGGFGIDGNLRANTPTLNIGDWLPGTNGSGGVLDASGVPLNSATTFHFVDLYNSTSDNTFSGGKWLDDPNKTWQWTTSKANSKTDINNVLFHIAPDTNGNSWIKIPPHPPATS